MVKNLLVQGLPYTWPKTYDIRTGTTGGKLVMRGPSALDAAGILSGNRLTFSLTAEQTRGLEPGLYFYEIRRFTAAGEEVIEKRRITVSVNLDDVEGGEFNGLSDNQRYLAMIQATIARRAEGGTPVRYRIGNRELYQEPLSDLMALLRHYQTLVDRELALEAGQNLFNRKIRISLK